VLLMLCCQPLQLLKVLQDSEPAVCCTHQGHVVISFLRSACDTKENWQAHTIYWAVW
jgi:hypothetical protein